MVPGEIFWDGIVASLATVLVLWTGRKVARADAAGLVRQLFIVMLAVFVLLLLFF